MPEGNLKSVPSIELEPNNRNSLLLLSLALSTVNFAEHEYAEAILDVYNSATSAEMQETLELLEVALKRWHSQGQRKRMKVVKRLQKSAQRIAAA